MRDKDLEKYAFVDHSPTGAIETIVPFSKVNYVYDGLEEYTELPCICIKTNHDTQTSIKFYNNLTDQMANYIKWVKNIKVY